MEIAAQDLRRGGIGWYGAHQHQYVCFIWPIAPFYALLQKIIQAVASQKFADNSGVGAIGVAHCGVERLGQRPAMSGVVGCGVYVATLFRKEHLYYLADVTLA